MASISSIALSGMNAAQTQLQASARNVTAQTVRAQAVGSSLETDVVAQLQAKNSFLANLAVFKTGNRLMGALLDQKA